MSTNIIGDWSITIAYEGGMHYEEHVTFHENGQISAQGGDQKLIGLWSQKENTDVVAVTMESNQFEKLILNLVGTYTSYWIMDHLYGNGVDALQGYEAPIPVTWAGSRYFSISDKLTAENHKEKRATLLG